MYVCKKSMINMKHNNKANKSKNTLFSAQKSLKWAALTGLVRPLAAWREVNQSNLPQN